MSVAKFANHLYGTPLSTAIRETSWIIPGVQSIHIIAIAGVVGAAIVMDLRLAGVLATDEAPRAVVKRHLPWMWSSLALLLTSGFVLGLGEPYRVLMNPVFWAKMALVLTGFVLTLLFRYPLVEDNSQRDKGSNVVNVRAARTFGAFQVYAEVLNILDSHDKDIAYLYQSYIPSFDAAPVEGRLSRVVEPRTLRGGVRVTF
ncbi:hypothetical protein C8J26_3760 [Sphingomonas aurantiaca]|uniref:DUF6644 domain-containing protein n=1 Tax=Sphingomonas aurantiaca TaxID=185949 RepID=A0A2T5GGJ2_9SPHN|nr:hypothetical protein C8J26_3760 [Sphingomonas aurantiaca]